MPVLDHIAVELVSLVERAVLDPRNATSVTSAGPSSTATTPAATSSHSSGGSSNPATNSPLLFFVALGFGVVFTNLWIIVGVKYCFRHNARNRQQRAAENGEPIVMENVPRRRRKREKKLMTMDEVNERFPMTKYKNWIAARASEGLPTTGGISVPPSRAPSIIDAAGVPTSPVESKHSDEERPATARSTLRSSDMSPIPESNAAEIKETLPSAEIKETLPSTESNAEKKVVVEVTAVDHGEMSQLEPAQTVDTTDQKLPDDEDDEEEEHIHTAVPPELLNSQGDTCAICLDVIEQDDDIRGLTCGHAFHAVCIDPWLTSRRACCPLCKADYYVPKPKTEEEANAERARRAARPAAPTMPPSVWTGMRGTPRLILPGRLTSTPNNRETGLRRPQATRRATEPEPRVTAANNETTSRRWVPSWASNIRLLGRNRPSEARSPRQLEAGH